MNNNEFAKVLKAKLEESNTLRASEEFIVECINGINTAKIVMSNGEGSNVSVALNLERVQKSAEENGWEAVIKTTEEALKTAREKTGLYQKKVDKMEDYSQVKSDLIIRPIHYNDDFIQKNAKQPCLYSKKGDIVLVLYMIMNDSDGILNTVRVPMNCVNEWKTQTGLTELEIFTEAMKNTGKLQVPTLYPSIFDVNEGSGIRIFNYQETLKENAVSMITTSRKTNGAIAMFIPGVKEKIAEMLGDSYYVAFTSIHEAMVHKKGSTTPSSIRENLHGTNRIFGEADTLTWEVFFYDKDTKEFTAVEF